MGKRLRLSEKLHQRTMFLCEEQLSNICQRLTWPPRRAATAVELMGNRFGGGSTELQLNPSTQWSSC